MTYILSALFNADNSDNLEGSMSALFNTDNADNCPLAPQHTHVCVCSEYTKCQHCTLKWWQLFLDCTGVHSPFYPFPPQISTPHTWYLLCLCCCCMLDTNWKPAELYKNIKNSIKSELILCIALLINILGRFTQNTFSAIFCSHQHV